MKIALLVIVVIGALAIVLFVAKRKFVAAEATIRLSDIPAVFEKMRTAGTDGSFAVFIFSGDGGQSADEAINVQFSIENGRVGFDWILLGRANIRDRERFVRFAEKLGYGVSAQEMNKVRYLRVEAGDLPRLCDLTIRDLYGISPSADLAMIPEGFTWP